MAHHIISNLREHFDFDCLRFRDFEKCLPDLFHLRVRPDFAKMHHRPPADFRSFLNPTSRNLHNYQKGNGLRPKIKRSVGFVDKSAFRLLCGVNGDEMARV